MERNSSVPILIPFEPEEFWNHIRIIIREEVTRNHKEQPQMAGIMETPGLTEKPLYKIQEICTLFKVTKPTIYDWIKHGKQWGKHYPHLATFLCTCLHHQNA